MNDEDKKYLRSAEKMRPSLEVFSRMVQILKSVDEKTDQLLNTIDNSLLETSRIVRI